MLSRRADQNRAVARVVRRRVDDVRERRNVAPLTFCEELNDIATDHAETMALRGELAHELDETTPQDRAAAYSQVGENIHREQTLRADANHVGRRTVQAWVESPGHYRNMMRDTASVGGVGVADSGDWVYVCLLLASGKKAQHRVTDTVRGWLRS